jgi:6-phosphogluconolactonase
MALYGELQVVEHVPGAFYDLVVQVAPRSLAISGGTTARQCYELLAVAPLPWSDVDIYVGDERWVPPSDPESNEGMARTAFIDQVHPRAVHPMYQSGMTIDDAARAYDDVVRAAPPIGLVHLGLGPDGHTASLFPGSPALGEQERYVLATGDDLHPHPRVTLTYPGIAHSELVVFTVAGEDKREAYQRVAAGDDLPATYVRAPRVVWLVDHAAHG